MLISEKHKFLFVHVYKTAGDSITSALLPYANSSVKLILHKALKRFGVVVFDPRPYRKHAFASEIISMMGRERYNSYFSFAFVRNPWDWQVSLYKFILRDPNNHHHEIVKGFTDFSEYIEWRCVEEVRHQKDFLYSDSGDKLVDYIGRFESLEDDFSFICDRIGISASLPRLNVSERRPYKEYYTSQTAELIRKTYQPDIELFGYEF